MVSCKCIKQVHKRCAGPPHHLVDCRAICWPRATRRWVEGVRGWAGDIACAWDGRNGQNGHWRVRRACYVSVAGDRGIAANCYAERDDQRARFTGANYRNGIPDRAMAGQWRREPAMVPPVAANWPGRDGQPPARPACRLAEGHAGSCRNGEREGRPRLPAGWPDCRTAHRQSSQQRASLRISFVPSIAFRAGGSRGPVNRSPVWPVRIHRDNLSNATRYG